MVTLRRGLSVVVTVIVRNRGLGWFAIVSVVFFVFALAPTPVRKSLWHFYDGLFDRVISASWSSFQSDIGKGRPDPKTITLEIQSAEIRQMLAKAAGLPLWRMEDLSITVADHGWTSNRPMPADFRSVMELYIQTRFEGHTRKYARAVIESVRAKPSIARQFLADVRQLKSASRLGSVIPEQYVSRVEKKIVNNQEQVTGFVVIDESLAWQHELFYREDGTMDHVSARRVDVMELDPNLTSLLKEAGKAADERMKKENIGGLGSCHTFWKYKQEFLREKGHDWKSPSELNPHILYD